MKRILFITSTNLAANPRLVRELRLATSEGYDTTVLQFIVGNWSDSMTAELQKEFGKTCFYNIFAMRDPLAPWLLSTVFEKLLRLLPAELLTDKMLSISINKRSMLLIQALKGLDIAFDWVIAHNPASFYPAMYFSRKFKIALGIDIEDYHPGEAHSRNMRNRICRLMNMILPEARYASFASELIRNAVVQDVSGIPKTSLLILNGSPRIEFTHTDIPQQDSLRLVWFSQHIDHGRGLESVLQIIEQIPQVELHLIGSVSKSYYEKFLANKSNVKYHEPLSQRDLHLSLANYDVGLAIEPGRDPNNQYAVSNKILASHTPGQDRFLENHEQKGYLQTDLDADSLECSIRHLVLIRGDIRKYRKERFLSGRSYDWEVISKELITVWAKG